MAPKVKTAKNSKLPKLSENCFDLVGKGVWPLVSTWIKKIRYLSKVLLGITCTKNKSITTINEVYLPPIIGENTLSSQEQLGFQPIKTLVDASAHLKRTRVSPPNNHSQVQQLKDLAFKSAKRQYQSNQL